MDNLQELTIPRYAEKVMFDKPKRGELAWIKWCDSIPSKDEKNIILSIGIIINNEKDFIEIYIMGRFKQPVFFRTTILKDCIHEIFTIPGLSGQHSL